MIFVGAVRQYDNADDDGGSGGGGGKHTHAWL